MTLLSAKNGFNHDTDGDIYAQHFITNICSKWRGRYFIALIKQKVANTQF